MTTHQDAPPTDAQAKEYAVLRAAYSHLDGERFATIQRMCSAVGGLAALRDLMGTDDSTYNMKIDAFRAHEASVRDAIARSVSEDASKRLNEQYSGEFNRLQGRIQERDQRLSQLTAALSAASQKTRNKPIKLDVSRFEGKDGEHIQRWFLEVEVAMQAAQITEDHLQVAFGMSHLKRSGVAHEWAYTILLNDPRAFTSWVDFKKQLFEFHQGKHMAHNHRALFLQCRQNKRSVYQYVQELRKLSASIIGDDIGEGAKITVLMEGLNNGPARTELFRRDPKTFEEALRIVLEEDRSQRRSGVHGGSKLVTSDGPTPMDLTLVETSNSRSNDRCFNCNQRGHYSRDCRSRRGQNRAGDNTVQQRPHAPQTARRGGHNGHSGKRVPFSGYQGNVQSR